MNLRAPDNASISRYYSNREKSFNYVSAAYQNTFIHLLSNQVRSKICNSVRGAKMYAIIVDESQDISRHEHAIVLRFVDDKFNIVESFLGFYPTDQTDGESMFNLIKTALVSAGLCIADVRAQCYDGAANMRGLYSGVAARFKQENPLSFYVHCYAHVLNLCIVDACSSVAVIRNAFGVMSSLHNLLEASAKRHANLRSSKTRILLVVVKH